MLALALALVAGAAQAEPAPPGSQLAPYYIFETAVYHLPLPKGDPAKVFKRLMAREKGLTMLERMPKAPPARPLVALRIRDAKDYAPPDSDAIQPGFSKLQAEQLAGTRRVTVLTFGGPSAQALASYRQGLALTAALARETGGFLWDEQSRKVFTPEAWARRQQWSPEGPPDVVDHVMVHLYRHGELLRMVTLGMSKFGLPDVVVNQVSASDKRAMGHLINLFCQRLLEGAAIEKGGRFSLAIEQVRHAGVREEMLASLKKNARRKVVLSLAVGKREEGDADNRLLEIVFPGPPAGLQERHVAALDELLGSEDGIVYIDHDAELLAASERARKKVLTIKPRYAKAPPDGEQLMVKTPFKTSKGGQEWMWVEVVRWNGRRIDGILQNDPDDVPGLKAGARIEVDETTIFDYTLSKADGSEEGNETGAILMKRQ